MTRDIAVIVMGDLLMCAACLLAIPLLHVWCEQPDFMKDERAAQRDARDHDPDENRRRLRVRQPWGPDEDPTDSDLAEDGEQ